MKTAVRIGVAMLLVIAGGLAAYWLARRTGVEFTEEIERTRVKPATVSDLLADDKLDDKRPTFDAALIDSRPFGPEANRWQVNLSAAVLALDVPDIRDDGDAAWLKLHPSYAAAAKAISGRTVLPSVNVISGKAKQFDDGLYAALDMHMADNREQGIRCAHVLARQVLTECPPGGDAYAWLWAALEVGGFLTADEATRRPARAETFVNVFRARGYESQIVGFYEWSEELKRTFRFLRFLQQDFEQRQGLADGLLRALQKNPSCVEMYQRMLAFYARLTNPLEGLSLLDLADNTDSVRAIAARKGTLPKLHFLPWSATKETDLFNQLYPLGLTLGADLMRDFIKAIRDGKLDLKPSERSGWYDYQIYALEAFVLPERGAESAKLQLTKKYKLRLIEAFKALVTKHRETHIRMGAAAGNAAGAPPEPEGLLSPRLRVEPNPTYFLRYARGYSFLQKFIAAEVEDLNGLRGARDGGWRDHPLGDELENMRMLFYGLHLVSCEDIGLAPQLLPGEVENTDHTRALAAKWLEGWQTDPDLAVDTRVAVPVYYDNGGRTRFWANIGVRAAPLSVRWARQPSWRPWPKDGDAAPWKEVEWHKLDHADYAILVDEFAEFDQPGSVALPRGELRKVCDGAADKAEIIRQLQR